MCVCALCVRAILVESIRGPMVKFFVERVIELLSYKVPGIYIYRFFHNGCCSCRSARSWRDTSYHAKGGVVVLNELVGKEGVTIVFLGGWRLRCMVNLLGLCARLTVI